MMVQNDRNLTNLENSNNLLRPSGINKKSYTIVKAIMSHQSNYENEFSFDIDDCFYLPDQYELNLSYYTYINVIHPRTKANGRIPKNKIEVIQYSTPSKAIQQPALLDNNNDNISNSNGKDMMTLAYVLYDTKNNSKGELNAMKGDAILILKELDSDYFFAQLIGKLGLPGRILKKQVELKEDLTTKSNHNSSVPLKKNHSLNNKPQPTVKPVINRRSESSPNTGYPFTKDSLISADWGILSPGLKPSLNTQVTSSSSSGSPTNSYHEDRIPISHISVESCPATICIKIKVYFSNQTNRITECNLDTLQRFHLELLESFPKEAGLTGLDRSLPYMPQWTNSVIFKEELNQYFIDLLMLNSKICKCNALFNLIESDLQVNSSYDNKTITTKETIKIKIQVGSDMVAFYLKPNEFEYTILLNKIQDRIGYMPKAIYCNDPDSHGMRFLLDEEVFNILLTKVSNKLILIID